MGGSPASVSQEGLSHAAADAWAREIRDYLLGRMSANRRIETLGVEQASTLDHPPIRRWWTFEGKRYRTLGGSLARNWETAIRMARSLDQTFNPRLRISDRADGVVDWGQTLARGPHRLRPEFVVRSSGVGLDDQERATLRGWSRWITNEWTEYTQAVGIVPHIDWGGLAADVEGPSTIDQLRRWAHTARRSRWPFLREVVADTIRPVLEPAELDRIPLPTAASQLFELLCLVRIARAIAPPPRELRWLDNESTGNSFRLKGGICYYQQGLDRKAVLATPDYAGALAKAIDVFGVGLPRSVDIAFDFDQPRAGFNGLIVEAKSGSQTFKNSVAQLRTYRAARPRRPGSRYIVWGVIEGPTLDTTTADRVAQALAVNDPSEDLWVFSDADAIAEVVRAIFHDSINIERSVE